jgi:hypothetical protein
MRSKMKQARHESLPLVRPKQSDGPQLETSNFLFVIMKIAESPTNEKNNKKLEYISSEIALRQWHCSCSFAFREPS